MKFPQILVAVFLFTISVQGISAQKLYGNDEKLDRLLFETNQYLYSFGNCLNAMYAKVSKNQKINQYSQSCNHETPWDVIRINDNLFGGHISSNYPQLFKALEELNRVCKAVVVDIKMERVDKQKLDAYFIEFEKAAADLNKASKPIRDRWCNAAMIQLPKEIAAYIQTEYSDFRELPLYLNPLTKTNFPEELVRKNTRISDSLLVLIEKKAETDRNVKMVLHSFSGAQNNKEYFIDQIKSPRLQDPSFSNDLYYQIHNQFNNGIISMLKVYYPVPNSMFLNFKPVNNAIDETALIRPLKFKAINGTEFTATVSKWDFKDADALAYLCEAVNRTVFQTNATSEQLFQLKKDIEEKIEGKRKKIYFSYDYKMDEGDFESAMGRLKESKNEVFPTIYSQGEQLLFILNDIRVTFEEIDAALKSKTSERNDFSDIEKLFERHKALVKAMKDQVSVMNKNINKANSPKLNAQDNWSKSARALREYCKLMEAELDNIEQKAFGEKPLAIDFSLSEKKASNLLEQEISMLTGIKRLGTSNGKCPYVLYERILDAGRIQHQSFTRYKDSTSVPFKKEYSDGYAAVIRYYNELVGEYNDFSLQGAERNTEFAKYDHPIPCVNELLLARTLQLPDMKINAVPIVKVDTPKVDTPKVDTSAVQVINAQPVRSDVPEMTKEYVAKCKPNNIIFMIDISSSMNSGYKLNHFKDDLESIAAIMRPEDKVSVVIFGAEAKLALKQTKVTQTQKWVKTIEGLKGKGGTQFNEGLNLAYEYMDKVFEPGSNNRIVLITDGAFNVSDESFVKVQRMAQTKSVVFSSLLYHPYGKEFGRLKELSDASGGNQKIISSRESGAPILFSELSVLN